MVNRTTNYDGGFDNRNVSSKTLLAFDKSVLRNRISRFEYTRKFHALRLRQTSLGVDRMQYCPKFPNASGSLEFGPTGLNGIIITRALVKRHAGDNRPVASLRLSNFLSIFPFFPS